MRLKLLVACFATACLIAVGAVWNAHRLAEADAARFLQSQLQTLQPVLGPVVAPLAASRDRPGLQKLFHEIVASKASNAAYFVVYDAEGKAIAGRRADGSDRISPSADASFGSEVRDRHETRSIQFPLRTGGELVGTLQIGLRMETQSIAGNAIADQSLLAGIFAIAFAGLVAFCTAGFLSGSRGRQLEANASDGRAPRRSDLVNGGAGPLPRSDAAAAVPDVSVEKEAGDASRDGEARFRKVFENSLIAMAIQDDKGRRIMANKALCDMLGRTREEVEQSHVSDFCHPDDVDDTNKIAEKLTKGQLNSIQFDKRFIRKDGAIVWANVNVAKLDDGDEDRNLAISQMLDVTDQKLAEEALRLSESRFRDFATISSDWFWEMDDRLRFSYLSPKTFQKSTGIAPDQLIGKSKRFLLRSEPAPGGNFAGTADVSELMALLEDHQPIRDFRISHGSGERGLRHLSISGQPVFDEEGKFLGYRGTGRNITGRITLESALRESEELHRQLFESTKAIIWELDPENRRFTYVSPSAFTILGYPVDAWKQDNFWIDHIHPDDRDRVLEYCSENAATGEGYEVDYRMIAANGEDVWLHDVVSGDTGGHRLRGIMIDITARKRIEDALLESEKRFRSVLEHAAIGLIGIDEDCSIQFFNAAAETMFGYEGYQVIGRNIATLIPSPEENGLDGFLRRYRETGEAGLFGVGQEVTGLRQNGENFPMHLRIGETQWDGRRLFVASVIDLTRQGELESQLRQSQKMEAIGQLTGGIAHDFNNILATILGSLEMVGNSLPEGGRSKRRVARAIRSAKRGADLTSRLLTFSRKQALAPEDTDPNRVISGMRDLLQRSLGESITVALNLAEDLWTIEVDAGQFENSLLNLAINARDAMQGSGSLIIETENVTYDAGHPHANLKSGNYVRISLADTGGGIPQEIQDRVFEPFFTTKEPGKGTGLGLSMVHGFIRQSNGLVEIASDVGRGTRVTLHLPAVDRQAPLPSETAPAHDEAGMREVVFVVEDDPDVLEFTSELLSDLNYEVRQASTAAKALEAMREAPSAEILLTDVVLPGGMSGADLAREVTALNPSIKILFMSGYAPEGLDLDAAVGGHATLIRKPFERNTLAKAVSQALQG